VNTKSPTPIIEEEETENVGQWLCQKRVNSVSTFFKLTSPKEFVSPVRSPFIAHKEVGSDGKKLRFSTDHFRSKESAMRQSKNLTREKSRSNSQVKTFEDKRLFAATPL